VSAKALIPIPPPPMVAEPGGGGGSEWVELIRAKNDIDAHLLTGRLNESGIETRAMTDRSAPGAWLYGGSNPWAPVIVLVRRLQLEDARLVLAEISLRGPEAPPPPRRRGPGFPFPLLWWIIALALGVIFTSLSVAATARSVGSCHLRILCPAPQSRTP
jgi:hypothetical protein